MFGFLNGGASVQGAASPSEQALAGEDCVSAVIEDLIAKKIVPTICSKASCPLMSGPANKGYKRSWKNLLLNKRYQLRFTLFMVGISALLMLGLGIWVMREANDATAVAKNHIVGEPCTRIPLLVEPASVDDVQMPTNLDDDTDLGSAAGSNAALQPSIGRSEGRREAQRDGRRPRGRAAVVHERELQARARDAARGQGRQVRRVRQRQAHRSGPRRRAQDGVDPGRQVRRRPVVQRERRRAAGASRQGSDRRELDEAHARAAEDPERLHRFDRQALGVQHAPRGAARGDRGDAAGHPLRLDRAPACCSRSASRSTASR